jgi:hypothetical protein
VGHGGDASAGDRDAEAETFDALGAHVHAAARNLLIDLPPDLAAISRDELWQHLLWLARAGTAGAAPGADASDDGAAADPGAVLVLRRRVLDSLRAELISSWAADPPPADEMLAAL